MPTAWAQNRGINSNVQGVGSQKRTCPFYGQKYRKGETMSIYKIETEFDLKLCEPSKFDMFASRAISDPIVRNTKKYRFKMNTKEKPTSDWLIEYFRDVRDSFVGTKTEDGLIVFSVDSRVTIKTIVDGIEKRVDVFQHNDNT